MSWGIKDRSVMSLENWAEMSNNKNGFFEISVMFKGLSHPEQRITVWSPYFSEINSECCGLLWKWALQLITDLLEVTTKGKEISSNLWWVY